MLLEWMAYSVLFGGFLYAAALAGDRLAATWNRSQRVVWAGALIVAAVAPALIALRPRAAETADAVATASASTAAIDVTVPAMQAVRARASIVTRAKRVVVMAESYVAPLWIGASLAWLVLFARGAIGLHRRRARWRSADLDGIRVLVAPDAGPAVVGVFAPRVVIPEWALSLDAPSRALMLTHEAEHIRARDPLLLVVAAFTTALFPWNAVLWLLVRRVRLAIEIDCDRRVLGASARQREYGMLLLAVGARQSASLPLATSLAERRPFLERRIRAMTTTTSRHPRLVSAACIALALVATTAAVRAPRPASLVVRETPPVPQSVQAPAVPLPAIASVSTPKSASPAPQVEKARRPALTQVSTADRARRGPDSLTVEQIRSLIASHNPTALTGDPDINTITLVVTADNRYVVSLAEWRPPMAFGGGRGVRNGDQYDLDAEKMAKMKMELARGRGAASQDTDTVRGAELKMALEKLQTIIEERRQKVDPIVADSERAAVKAELAARLGKAADERKTILGEQLGINTEALSTLIGIDTIDSVHLRNFAAGELGTTALRVFIVKQKS